MIWTPDVISRAVSLKARGLSHAQVARKLGTTRNAVIGKLWRIDGRVTRGEGMGRPVGSFCDTWDVKVFESYADRKTRLANEARNKTANVDA